MTKINFTDFYIFCLLFDIFRVYLCGENFGIIFSLVDREI